MKIISNPDIRSLIDIQYPGSSPDDVFETRPIDRFMSRYRLMLPMSSTVSLSSSIAPLRIAIAFSRLSLKF